MPRSPNPFKKTARRRQLRRAKGEEGATRAGDPCRRTALQSAENMPIDDASFPFRSPPGLSGIKCLFVFYGPAISGDLTTVK